MIFELVQLETGHGNFATGNLVARVTGMSGGVQCCRRRAGGPLSSSVHADAADLKSPTHGGGNGRASGSRLHTNLPAFIHSALVFRPTRRDPFPAPQSLG